MKKIVVVFLILSMKMYAPIDTEGGLFSSFTGYGDSARRSKPHCDCSTPVTYSSKKMKQNEEGHNRVNSDSMEVTTDATKSEQGSSNETDETSSMSSNNETSEVADANNDDRHEQSDTTSKSKVDLFKLYFLYSGTTSCIYRLASVATFAFGLYKVASGDVSGLPLFATIQPPATWIAECCIGCGILGMVCDDSASYAGDDYDA